MKAQVTGKLYSRYLRQEAGQEGSRYGHQPSQLWCTAPSLGAFPQAGGQRSPRWLGEGAQALAFLKVPQETNKAKQKQTHRGRQHAGDRWRSGRGGEGRMGEGPAVWWWWKWTLEVSMLQHMAVEL